MPDKITSLSNPRIRHLVELQKKAKIRRETGTFIVEGTRLCLDTPAEFLVEAYMTGRWRDSASEADLRHFSGIPVTIVTDEVMAKASDTGTPQGILCVAKMPEWKREDLLGTAPRGDTGKKTAPSARKPLLLVLEDLQDPGNLGTIFRTAEAAGATGLLLSRGTTDPFHPKTVRATMSALFRMPFLVCDSLAREMDWLHENGIRTCAAHLHADRPYDALPLTEGTAFLIGNEGNGLSDSLTQAAKEKIIIPMCGGTESLNAAMAAGILLFEAARQRRNGSGRSETKHSDQKIMI